ncbi:hypothetical protein K402DRAFT_320597 [Aulographum hederae CBS 113979]|uniref:Uncharacterized protein n=1 Tax=Aulographum hederae CBS 113979 TaxID=1176131 RepID=A0A6G1HGZ6_9PEZI|nr:hypothetical protein K402DRAFT_320597 [Aulographum hederae CBS 113979]
MTVEEKVKETLHNTDKTNLINEYILESLTYPSMKDREDDVMEAHRDTFSWIFQGRDAPQAKQETSALNESNDFTKWLSTDDLGSIYWISGKPGSGKSTFMGFLNEHRETGARLQHWSDGTQLVTANFFFWTSGSYDQRSQRGLLRYLLYQILQQRPELTAWAFPELWLKSQDTKTRVTSPPKWTVTDTMEGLRNVVELAVKESKVCFFIDGLDEFDGDKEEVVRLLKSMLEGKMGRVKICVSSRPWSVFEDAFQEVPQLKLHDLTASGMDRYAKDKLNADPKVCEILQKEPEAGRKFQEELVAKADGVFLWITLAVRSLVENGTVEDGVAGLEKKLQGLPADLDDFFCYLLFQTRPSTELADQSRIIQLVRAREDICDFTRDDSARSITSYQLAFALGVAKLPSHGPISQIPDGELIGMNEGVKAQLRDLCADLLLLQDRDPIKARFSRNKSRPDGKSPRVLAESRIGYLHRTVRDFLLDISMWNRILDNGDSSFDPHMQLLRSHVQQLRHPLEEPESHRRLDDWWPDIVLAMTHARNAQEGSHSAQFALLDDLNETLNWYWAKKESDPLDNWARNAFGAYEVRMKRKIPFHHPFLSLAAKFGLGGYLRCKLESRNFAYQAGIPVLSHAIELLIDRRKTVYPLSSPALIQTLLEQGENPNEIYQDLFGRSQTTWLLALQYVREGDRRGWISAKSRGENGTERWMEIMSTFIRHGADPDALVVADSMDPAATALDVSNMLVEKYGFQEFVEFNDLLIKSGATAVATESR